MKAKDQGKSTIKLRGKIWLVLFYVTGLFVGGFIANGIATILSNFFYRTFVQNFNFYSLLGFNQPFSFETESALGGLPPGTTVVAMLFILLYIGLGAIPYIFLRRFVTRNVFEATRLLRTFKIGLSVTTGISLFGFLAMVAGLVIQQQGLGMSFAEVYGLILREGFQPFDINAFVSPLALESDFLPIVQRLEEIWATFLYLAFCLALVANSLGNFLSKKLLLLSWGSVGFYFVFSIFFNSFARLSLSATL